MNNFIQKGDTLTLVAPYNIASGDGMLVGKIFAVAMMSALQGAEVEGCRTGVYALKKKAAQAWTQGIPVYWDDTNKQCDTTSTVGIQIGFAANTASNPSDTGDVVLMGGTTVAAS